MSTTRPHFKKRKKNALKSIEMLIADNDLHMAYALSQNLRVMGFGPVHRVRNGEAALAELKSRPYDVLITEWPMDPIDGIELVRRLRHDDDSPARGIPIIMLTGKGEKAEVETARDAGITEFIVKPYSTKTLFSHLEQLIEKPRGFLLSPGYTGPDRRRSQVPLTGEDRRVSPPTPIDGASVPQGDEGNTPRLMPPDQSLKHKITVALPLSKIITPKMLKQAQATIDALADESLVWIKRDLKHLEVAYIRLDQGDINALKPLKAAALSIKSRAGTFGFHLTSDIARLLYRFASSDYKATVAPHRIILLKHIRSLEVTIANNVTGQDGEADKLIIKELEQLVANQRHLR